MRYAYIPSRMSNILSIQTITLYGGDDNVGGEGMWAVLVNVDMDSIRLLGRYYLQQISWIHFMVDFHSYHKFYISIQTITLYGGDDDVEGEGDVGCTCKC